LDDLSKSLTVIREQTMMWFDRIHTSSHWCWLYLVQFPSYSKVYYTTADIMLLLNLLCCLHMLTTQKYFRRINNMTT